MQNQQLNSAVLGPLTNGITVVEDLEYYRLAPAPLLRHPKCHAVVATLSNPFPFY